MFFFSFRIFAAKAVIYANDLDNRGLIISLAVYLA